MLKRRFALPAAIVALALALVLVVCLWQQLPGADRTASDTAQVETGRETASENTPETASETTEAPGETALASDSRNEIMRT